MTVVVLVGPTAAGKSTVEGELQRMGYGRVVSHTTRAPRDGEVNGVNYHFVDSEQFEEMSAACQFIETFRLGTNSYGVSAGALVSAQRGSKDVALVVEPNGAENILRYCDKAGINTFAVFLDCQPQEQARRYLQRIDIEARDGRSMTVWAERLGIMLSSEVQWRSDARAGFVIAGSRYPCRYDMLIHDTAVAPPAWWAASIDRAVKALAVPQAERMGTWHVGTLS